MRGLYCYLNRFHSLPKTVAPVTDFPLIREYGSHYIVEEPGDEVALPGATTRVSFVVQPL